MHEVKWLGRAVCAAVVCVCFLVSTVSATPIAWEVSDGGNGHYYEFIEVADPYRGSNNTWTTARDNAAASVYNNLVGHLATITSQGQK